MLGDNNYSAFNKMLNFENLLVLLLAAGTLVLSYGPFGDKPIRGVNLGGWLVLEKWIAPSVFNGLPDNIKDEWTLCEYLGRSEAEKRLRSHWDRWVTESDIATLKKAGIDHLRIPFGYWALEPRAGEPYVQGSWDYVMKAVRWAKNHDMKVMIDLHGAPGSQNGNDHSGRAGSIGFYYDDSNLQLATKVIGRVARLFNAPTYRSTVSIIQLLNEPILWGNDYNYRLNRLKQYYSMAYKEVRKYNDIAVVAVHDAFIDQSNWYYLRDDPSYYWVMLDTHHYQVFTDSFRQMSCDQHRVYPCQMRSTLQQSNQKLWTVVGEWSLATPPNCKNQAEFARNQIGVFESISGWFMWNFKHEVGWNEWDFLASYKKGWIPKLGDNRVTASC